MWPPEAIAFLEDLEDNNDGAWFRANRSRYDEFLMAPARKFADGLAKLGEPHFFRPYNDTRFRPGPPLKEHFGMALRPGTGGAYYLEVSLDGVLVAAGMHQVQGDQIERFRAAVADGRRARGFGDALAVAQQAGLSVAEPELKRAPRGYPADHPRLDWLRMKRLVVHRRREVGPWLHNPRAATTLKRELEAAQPLMQWLGRVVGASERSRG
jgi:uncharacterized protein (TIGR02453 family)